MTPHQSSQLSPHQYGGGGQYHHNDTTGQYRDRSDVIDRPASYAPPALSQYTSSARYDLDLVESSWRDSMGAHSQNSNQRFIREDSLASTNPEFEPSPINTQRSTQPSQHLKRRLGDPAAVSVPPAGTVLPVTRQSTGGRGSNFNKASLEQLCKSWLNVSEDSINGTDQKATNFWQKIIDDFNSRMPKADQRSLKSLDSR